MITQTAQLTIDRAVQGFGVLGTGPRLRPDTAGTDRRGTTIGNRGSAFDGSAKLGTGYVGLESGVIDFGTSASANPWIADVAVKPRAIAITKPSFSDNLAWSRASG